MNRISRSITAFVLAVATFVAPAVPLVMVGGLAVTQTACPESKNLASYAHEVVGVIDDVVPIFQANGLPTARLTQARGIAAKLEIAFRENQSQEALALVSALIPVFQQIVGETTGISNGTTRTIVLVSLAVANVALRRIADKLAEQPVPESVSASAEAQTVAAFRASKKWRCRNSATGRFESMSYCKKNPATSEVETR